MSSPAQAVSLCTTEASSLSPAALSWCAGSARPNRSAAMSSGWPDRALIAARVEFDRAAAGVKHAHWTAVIEGRPARVGLFGEPDPGAVHGLGEIGWRV